VTVKGRFDVARSVPEATRRLASVADRRWVQRGARVAVVYALTVAVFHAMVFAGVAAARALGYDTRRSTLGSVRNLRPIDDRVWAGGQPTDDQYRRLAAQGVRLVVDLRTDADDDVIKDDADLLAALGVERLHLPIPDGHVPTAAQTDALVDAVSESDGLVFVHCGAGVGRTAATAAAYLAATGRDPSLAEALAVGTLTLEQIWDIATRGPGDTSSVGGPIGAAVRILSEAIDAPRRAINKAQAGNSTAFARLGIGALVLGASLAVLRRSGRANASREALRSVGERPNR
jgi:protein tyrosine phosphatase (PTP) superfamily phosphohydrolase (DUF442 family)